MASALPTFAKAGDKGQDFSSGKILPKMKAGEILEIVALTGVNPPEGETPTGSNCICAFQEYTLWIDRGADEKGFSPSFPNIGGPEEIGALLGLQPRFKGMMLVARKGEEEEKILTMGVQVYNQLVEIEKTLGESIKGQVLRIKRVGSGQNDTKYTVIQTGKRVTIEGDPETDMVPFMGPLTREGIVAMLEKAGQWPPKSDADSFDDSEDDEDEVPKKKSTTKTGSSSKPSPAKPSKPIVEDDDEVEEEVVETPKKKKAPKPVVEDEDDEEYEKA